MKNKPVRHQIKSSWYYLFWAIMTAAVVTGQLYVGTSYKAMSNSIEKLINNGIVIR